MPTTVVTTIGSGGDHATVALWEAATDNDLVTLDEIQEGRILNDLTIVAQTTIAGATTSATQYRHLTADPGVEYEPIGDTGIAITTTAGVSGILLNESHVHLSKFGLLSQGTSWAIEGNVSRIGTVINRMFVTSESGGIIVHESGATYRNSVIKAVAGTGIGFRIQSNGIDLTLQDVVVDGFSSSNVRVFVATIASTAIENVACVNSLGLDFEGTYSLGALNNNLSSDTSAPGNDPQHNADPDAAFTDPAANDYTLLEGGDAADNGIDLSGQFTDDFAGTTRTAPWDIGAYDFVVLSPGAFLRRIEHVPAPNPLLRM